MPRSILPTLVVGIGEFGRLTVEHVRRRLEWTDDPDPAEVLFDFFLTEADTAPAPAGDCPPPQLEPPDPDSEVRLKHDFISLPLTGPKAQDTLTHYLRPILKQLDDAPATYRKLVDEVRAETAFFERSDPLARELGHEHPEPVAPRGNAVRAIVLAELARPEDAELARIAARAVRKAVPLDRTLHAVGVFSLCAERESMPQVFEGLRDLGLLGAEAPEDTDDGSRLCDKAYVFFTRSPEESLSEVADRAELAGEWCYAMLHMDAVALSKRHCLEGRPAAIGARTLLSSTIPVAERAARGLALEVVEAMEPDLKLCDAAGAYDPEGEQPDDEVFRRNLARLTDDYQAALTAARERTHQRVEAILHKVTVDELINYVHFVHTVRDRELWADQVRSLHAMVHHDLLARCRTQALEILQDECQAFEGWMTARVRQVLYGWLRPPGEGQDGGSSADFVLTGLSHAYHWVQCIVYEHDEREAEPSLRKAPQQAPREEFDEVLGDLEHAVYHSPYTAGLAARLGLAVLLVLYLGLPVAWRLVQSSRAGWGALMAVGIVGFPLAIWLIYGLLPDWRARGYLDECLSAIRKDFEAAQERIVEDICDLLEERAVKWIRRDLIDSDEAPMRRYGRKLRRARELIEARPVFEPRPARIIAFTPPALGAYARQVLEQAREAVREWFAEQVAPSLADTSLSVLSGEVLAGALSAAARSRCLTVARQVPELAAIDDWFARLDDGERRRNIRWLRDGSAPYVKTTQNDHGVLTIYLACTGEQDAFATDDELTRDVKEVIAIPGSGSATLIQVLERFDLRHTTAFEAAERGEPPEG